MPETRHEFKIMMVGLIMGLMLGAMAGVGLMEYMKGVVE